MDTSLPEEPEQTLPEPIVPEQRSPTRLGAILGGLLWCVFLIILPRGGGPLTAIAPLLLLAILVFTPLVLELVAPPGKNEEQPWPYMLARLLHPFAAASAGLSFLVEPGTIAGIFASVWLIFALLLALFAVGRIIVRRSLFPLHEFALDLALLYLPIGAAWLVASRLNIVVMGFGGVIAILTAVHFHYAGMIASVIVGMIGRRLPSGTFQRLYPVAALAVMAGPPLVAAGITFSERAPIIEVVSAAILTIGMMISAVILLGGVLPVTQLRRSRWLLGIAAAASVVAMVLALIYALSTFMEIDAINIPRMVMLHGVLNATYALCALLGLIISNY